MRTPRTEGKSGVERPQLSPGAGSGLGIRGLPKQVYFMVLLTFIFALGRFVAYTYLTMFLVAPKEDGGLSLDPSLVGFIIMIYMLSSTFALLVTGSLCDRFGRRKMMGTCLIPQVILTFALAYAGTYIEVLLLLVLSGAMGAFYDPAFGAMVADLVPPSRREAVFGLSYQVTNIATMIAMPIGGMIADASGYPILFIYASCFGAIGLAIFLMFIKESRPMEAKSESSPRSARIPRDKLYFLFCFTGIFTLMVYTQLNNLLVVYVGRVGFPDPNTFFGLLGGLNGAMVVLLQIPIRKGAMKFGATRSFVLAQLLIAAGFTYFMVAVTPIQFVVGVIILTLGEIIFFPTSSGFAANRAPPDMRGRYMAMMGLFFGIGGAAGTFMSFTLYGALTDYRLVWGILGLIGFAALLGYVALLRKTRTEKKTVTIEDQK